MSKCNRCGEHNHADARYCGTCGTVLPTEGGIESLVADESGSSDVTAPGVEPGSAEIRPSEYVSPPSFGETGPVADPAPIPATQAATPNPPFVRGPTTVVVPPIAAGNGPGTGIERGYPTPVEPESTSTGLTIAALAVAAVVIIGGVFVLLSRDSGGSDAARTGDSAAPTAPSTDPLPSEPPVTIAIIEPAPSTVPPETVPPATAPLSTVAPPPAPTSPPTPASTVPTSPPTSSPASPSPTPTRGPGDLGLTQPILNESCDGRYITFVGSAVGDRPYNAVVAELLENYPGTNYIWTKACPSLRQEFVNGADIYGVVFGPYGTQQEACSARASGPDDAYVRRISTTDSQDHTIGC